MAPTHPLLPPPSTRKRGVPAPPRRPPPRGHARPGRRARRGGGCCPPQKQPPAVIHKANKLPTKQKGWEEGARTHPGRAGRQDAPLPRERDKLGGAPATPIAGRGGAGSAVPPSPAPPPAWSGGPGRTYGVPALREHGSGHSGVPSQRGSHVELSALSRLHTPGRRGGRSGDTRQPLSLRCREQERVRRRSVPAPRGHPPAAASFVAVVPGRAGVARRRGRDRARDGHRRSTLLQLRSGRRAAPTQPGRGGTGPDGTRGWRSAAPTWERIMPLSDSQGADATVRPETSGAGDFSPHFCLLPRGENPGGRSGSRCQWWDRRKPGGRAKVSGEGRDAPGRRLRGQVIGKIRSDEQERKAGRGGGRGRRGPLHSRPRSEPLQ